MNENRGLWRGKRINNKKHNGEWAEGFLYPVKYTGSSIPGYIDYYIGTYPSGAGMQQIQVDPSTLGECTGLTDKNGVKIFEGDITKAKWQHLSNTDTVIGVVKYDDAAFILETDDNYLFFEDNIFSYECEVIGNIHDNPELLEGGEING